MAGFFTGFYFFPRFFGYKAYTYGTVEPEKSLYTGHTLGSLLYYTGTF